MFKIKKAATGISCGILVAGILSGGMSGAYAAPGGSSEFKTIENHFSNSREFSSENFLQDSGEQNNATPAGLFAPSSIENINIQEGVATPEVIGTCRVTTGSDSCTISLQKTLTATISGEVSVGFNDVNAAIGGSYSESITQQWQCEGKPTGNTQLEMHPSGVFVQFEYVHRVMGVETSRTPASAFIPTGVDCQTVNV